MNKAELVQAMTENGRLTRAQASEALEAFLVAVSDALKANDTVTLVGWGTFAVQERDARPGRNPQTGEPIMIAAARIPKFKPGKAFKEAISPP